MSKEYSYSGNLARALLGQGVGLGWGDEAEAWLRSKMGDESYEQELAQIQQSYGQFAEDNPWSQGLAEFTGAVVPGVVAAIGPGTQPAAPAALGGTMARLSALLGGKGTVQRVAATGAGAGGLSAAGYAEHGDKLGAAVPGAVVGGAVGAALPLAGRGAGAGYDFLKERIAPSAQTIEDRAGRKLLEFVRQGGYEPAGIPLRLGADQAMGVPSVVANVDPALARLAESVAQRSGAGARKVEDTLIAQGVGRPERIVGQTRKRLGAGDYYNDLEGLQTKIQNESREAYAKAYADGTMQDPKKIRKLHNFLDARPGASAAAMANAKRIADARGEVFDMDNPSVETLDQIKRGLDGLIEGEMDTTTGKLSTLGQSYLDMKTRYLKMVDEFSPDYKAARANFGDNKTVEEAFMLGRKDYLKLPHEEAVRLVAGMRPVDKQALRTGVARDIYDKVMSQSRNVNAAQNLIGAPEMRARLQPLFDNPGEYRLFEAALKREAQLHAQASKILGGSQTAQRQRTAEMLDSDVKGGDLVNLAQGNFGQSLIGMLNNVLGSAKLPEKTADKLADMLMAKDPADVAAVVALLERTAAQQGKETLRAGARESGATTGLLGAGWPAPLPEDEQQ